MSNALVPFRGELIEQGRRWTADELSSLQARVFEALRARQVGPGSRVVVAFEDHARYLTSVWAIRALGAVAVLLASGRVGAVRDVAILDRCLLESDPHHLLVDAPYARALSNAIRRSGVATFVVSEDGAFESVASGNGDVRSVHPDDTALLCFTSGTEYTPKGVLLAGRTLDYLAETGKRLNDWSPDEAFLSCLPLTHMFGFNHSTTALRSGARVVVSPPFTFIGEVVKAITQHRITTTSIPPHLLALLLRVGGDWFKTLTHLKRLWFGGAQIIARDVEAAMERCPHLRVGNIYGLTEALRSAILDAEDIPGRLPSIGRPMAGVEIELRDEDGRPLSGAEATGLAWIRGPNVMLGYWKRADATAAVLRDGWFCSNDRVRRSADGYLWLEGRSKEILSFGGEKLSPALIEQHIIAGCGVADVAVLAIETHADTDEIVVVIQGDDAVTLDAIRAACRPHVHSGFLPTRLLRVEQFPWKAEGKLDRAALRRLLGLGPRQRVAPTDSGGP